MIDTVESRAASVTERWYVVIVMCLVYAVNIADRYVVSTVLEPIRLELKLTDAGVGFLTGVPLGLFYVSFGIPMSWLADCRVGLYGRVRPGAQLLAVPRRAHRRRCRRGGRHATGQFHHRGPLSGGS